MVFSRFKNIFFILLFFSSCTIIRKAPKDKPYLFKNSIQLNGGTFSTAERESVLQRLSNQLDDSSKVTAKDAFFIIHTIKRPPAYDTAYSRISSVNMQSSMYHLGYYNARVHYTQDTIGKKVYVKYIVDAGKPTLIDTLSYRLNKPELQQIALNSKKETLLKENNPVTKTAVLAEVSRLVDSFRNNGYYKFTAAELRVRGDTTIAALTTVTDDPFEQLRLLQEAQQKKDSPEIKLAIVINKPEDTTKLNKYYINKIYILSDFRPTDDLSDSSLTQRESKNKTFILRYHQPIFRTALFVRNITLRSGDVYRQEEYYKTLNNLSRLNVWQSVNIRVIENLDDSNKVDLVFELIPAKKFSFVTSLEASYSSSNSNTSLGGNLFGLGTNFSLINKNIGREAIKMTHTLRAGVELNNNSRVNSGQLINSSELGYSNTVIFPRLITPSKKLNNNKKVTNAQSFINLNVSLNNRVNLFSLQSVNLNHGYTWTGKKNRQWAFRILNAEFSYLFNESDSFSKLIQTRPFLKYSYNTSFIIGTGANFSTTYLNPVHRNSLTRERTIKLNGEESGLTWGALPIINKYKRKYVKLDAEYRYTVTYPNNTALAYRFFAGVGIPLSNDTTLPFFKQYFGGGSNSMRGWPVRGIGRGSQKLEPFQQKNIFNDRTGDMQLETNLEYRYDIARIIPNLLTIRGALFIDAGNIWNVRNSRPDGLYDSAQFKIQNLYREIGVSAGTGFRFDFNYLVLRFDLGFRFKRPELSFINNGWKAPSLSFNDVLPKIFSKNYRQWRYENFNFTIGINYPF